jgi:hypothetical protein
MEAASGIVETLQTNTYVPGMPDRYRIARPFDFECNISIV